jgi:hypothetical protein
MPSIDDAPKRSTNNDQKFNLYLSSSCGCAAAQRMRRLIHHYQGLWRIAFRTGQGGLPPDVPPRPSDPKYADYIAKLQGKAVIDATKADVVVEIKPHSIY